MGVMVSGVGMYDYVYIYENYDIIKSIMNKYVFFSFLKWFFIF